MKTTLAITLALTGLAATASAQCNPCRKAVVAQHYAVSFAVPVGVPVAAVSPYGATYQYQGFRHQAVTKSEDERIAEIAAKAASEATVKTLEALGIETKAIKTNPIQQHCARCHGNEGKHSDVFHIDALASPAVRARAAEVLMVPGKMPSGMKAAMSAMSQEDGAAVVQFLLNSDNWPVQPESQ